MQASPGWLYLREADGSFARPTQQHLVALDSANGRLQYFPLREDPGSPFILQALGSFDVYRSEITPLEGTGSLQVALEGGHVVHIDTPDEAQRDRWCLELNFAGLRRASGGLQEVAARAATPPPPAAVSGNGAANGNGRPHPAQSFQHMAEEEPVALVNGRGEPSASLPDPVPLPPPTPQPLPRPPPRVPRPTAMPAPPTSVVCAKSTTPTEAGGSLQAGAGIPLPTDSSAPPNWQAIGKP